jgi:predicted porin
MMRKLLLASAAAAAGSLGLAATANAQFANVNQTPVANQAGAFGTATPGPAAGPGSITVRLNGRLSVDAAVVGDSGRNSASGNTKQAPYALGSYARLYPGFDGVAGNGMRYGASLEVRQDNTVATGGGAFGSISASNRSRGALYWRREMAYLGIDGVGTFRFGAADGPSALFYTGVFENFNDSAWNGDLPSFFTQGATPAYPFALQGPLYSTEKVMYLSPQFFGVDFGIAFEPGTGAVNQQNGNCTITTAASASGLTGNFTSGGATSCDAASATGLFGESARRRNTIDAQVRYRGAFGPVGLAVTGGWMTGGHVAFNGPASGIPASGQFKGIDMYDAGLQVTYGGLAVGGHITGGNVNSGFGLLREGQKDSFAWLAGASYTFGQFIVGGSYYQFQYAGSQTRANNAFVGQNRDTGLAAGGTWTFAPGMNVFLSYLYGTRSAGNVNLLTGAAGTTAATGAGGQRLNNNTQVQGLMVGTAFRW